ncbi:ribosomal protein RPL14 [Cardiosporidium cionae]|uniref:Ribosomal protein RPL14 n=1 Tax=Cardiosporidium cionae TaxID=476202 RepID=A0ABQ7J7I2_9APIC|nr:ribosomal protein RPL14 [Cardiosporidium cionae]|eukprot:KAF8819931.1 ribosomal protein RPL14 [Cardiosporidium cionae]
MALFNRFIEAGRLCVIQFGPDYGKLCFIVDVINENRVLIDGESVSRQAIPIKRLALTDLKVSIPRGIRTRTLKRVIKESDTIAKFNSSSWGKKMIFRTRKAQMTDFDRFKMMVIRTQRAAIKRREINKLKRSAKA